MRVLLSTVTTLVLAGASAATAVPAASMEMAIPGDQARSAVAAALAQANSTGVTFIQSRDGTPTQRNAAGTVVVGVEDGKIVNMVLREGGSTSLLGILRDPPRDPKVRRQVFRAYGVGGVPYVTMPVEPDQAVGFDEMFDPFTLASAIPTAEVIVDARGRATEIRVGDDIALKVLSWSAPLAVRPPQNRILDQNTYWTVLLLEDTTSYLESYVGTLAGQATATPGYRSAPVATLRRAAKQGGWTVTPNRTGVSVTVTSGLGATWRYPLTAGSQRVSLGSPTLLTHPAVVPEEIAQAKSLIGLLAMTSVGQLGCSLECSLSGKVPQWTYQSAVPRMVEALAGFDVAGVTSGPPYPGTSEARVSVGNVGSASDFTAGFAVSGDVKSGERLNHPRDGTLVRPLRDLAGERTF
ncbi:MAG: hypothetical protein ACKOE2_11775, partial [Actinomycetales bacterium]